MRVAHSAIWSPELLLSHLPSLQLRIPGIRTLINFLKEFLFCEIIRRIIITIIKHLKTFSSGVGPGGALNRKVEYFWTTLHHLIFSFDSILYSGFLYFLTQDRSSWRHKKASVLFIRCHDSIFPRFILSNFALIIQLHMLTHFRNSVFVTDLS